MSTLPSVSPKGRGAVRVATERVSSLASITDRLKILGAPDDMIENLAWQWDNFDDDWTPDRQRELVTWSDDRLFREVTGILAEYHDSTNASDDPRQLAILAARIAAQGTVDDVIAWVAEAPIDSGRSAAALAAEQAGKMRGKLIKTLELMTP